MGVDVQRGGRLAVAQQARHSGYISPAGDQETGVGVPQGVDVQRSRKALLLEDQLEPLGEGGGCHREPGPMAAEDVVCLPQLSVIVGLRLLDDDVLAG